MFVPVIARSGVSGLVTPTTPTFSPPTVITWLLERRGCMAGSLEVFMLELTAGNSICSKNGTSPGTSLKNSLFAKPCKFEIKIIIHLKTDSLVYEYAYNYIKENVWRKEKALVLNGGADVDLKIIPIIDAGPVHLSPTRHRLSNLIDIVLKPAFSRIMYLKIWTTIVLFGYVGCCKFI